MGHPCSVPSRLISLRNSSRRRWSVSGVRDFANVQKTKSFPEKKKHWPVFYTIMCFFKTSKMAGRAATVCRAWWFWACGVGWPFFVAIVGGRLVEHLTSVKIDSNEKSAWTFTFWTANDAGSGCHETLSTNYFHADTGPNVCSERGVVPQVSGLANRHDLGGNSKFSNALWQSNWTWVVWYSDTGCSAIISHDCLGSLARVFCCRHAHCWVDGWDCVSVELHGKRNESECMGMCACNGPWSWEWLAWTDSDPESVLSKSINVQTQKTVSVATLACKSFLKLRSAWFPQDTWIWTALSGKATLSNFNWTRTSGYFGEPLVQVTTPNVALNCLINCFPSAN